MKSRSSTKSSPDKLYLLEFLVEKIEIYPRALPHALRTQPGGICLVLTFFENGPLDICEEEFSPVAGCPVPSSQPRNGKSCLFALEPSAASAAAERFDIDVLVYKVLEKDEPPTRIRIGEASVSIAEAFGAVVVRSARDSHGPVTETQLCNVTLRGTIPNAGCCIGDVNLFIRVSCFGRSIVTQIQMNEADESVLFQDRSGKALYRYSRRRDAVDEICRSEVACATYGLRSLPCVPRRRCCALPSSCFPECQPGCCASCASCVTRTQPVPGYAICGTSPVCSPMCGLPCDSHFYYTPCFPSPKGNGKKKKKKK